VLGLLLLLLLRAGDLLFEALIWLCIF